MDEQKIVIVEEEVNKTGMERQKILIVDDEEVNRAILENLFQDEYAIVQAANGQEAIEQIEANKDLTLVLLDIVMPCASQYPGRRAYVSHPQCHRHRLCPHCS